MPNRRPTSMIFFVLGALLVFFSSPWTSGAAPFAEETPTVLKSTTTTGEPTGAAAGTPHPPENAGGKGTRVRIASYNIAHGRGVKVGGLDEIAKLKNLQAIAALLRQNQVDIIGFSEISSRDARAKFVNQPKYLAKRLGFHHVYAENTERGWGLLTSQGNAVLSRFPIIWSKNHSLFRADPKNEQRGCLETLIDLGEGRRLRFLICHLSTNREESPKQIEQIWELVKASKEPVALAGDFNLRPHADSITFLAREMRDATANLVTSQAVKDSAGSKIDYIFVTGPITFEKAWAVGVKEKLSDHDCLINTFWVGDTKKEP
jgi:endonuclease/exonuclease/phosphatase family metal-dependent hydrolase